ncbi:hypothetical protein NC01_09155 [Streptococcus uberis]|nr:hypothetical protein NC01_09155 [Streptococcus uberis]
MKTAKQVKVVEKSFNTLLYAKLVFALGESLSGLLLFVFKHSAIKNLITILTSRELANDPHDFIASHLVHLGSILTLNGQRMAAIYLLFHGLIKVLTLLLLLKKKLWAYPMSLFLFMGFIVYQMREFMLTHHMSMIFLSLIDILMMILTYLEYQKLKGNLMAK